MHLPSLFVLLVYVSGYLGLLFAAVCLACGLYYVIELAEEYTAATRRILRAAITAQLVIHILLLVYERFPFLPCFIGFAAHLAYYNLLSTFPVLHPTSAPFVAAAVLFVTDTALWFRFFRAEHELFFRYRVAPFPAAAAFLLLVVWFVPVALFCSLSVNDAVLPGGPGLSFPPQHHSHSPLDKPQPRRRNILVAAIDSLRSYFP